MITGGLIDHALATTAKRSEYAAVPMPWLSDWMDFVEHLHPNLRPQFHWNEFCGIPGWDFGKGNVSVDDEGNILLCLMLPRHGGPCGFAHLLEQAS